jgi:Phage tail lysozyme
MSKYYDNAEQIYQFWLSVGLTKPQACGMLAQADAESSLNPSAVGDKGKAFGLHQLHADRCELIQKGCDIDITKLPSLEDQLKGVWWELQHSEHHALAEIKTAITPYDAGAIACKYYERPAAATQQQYRGKKAQNWFSYFNPEVKQEA